MSRTNGNQSRGQSNTTKIITPDQGGSMAGRGERWPNKASDYYHIPLITKAHWSWEIVLYFFFGGVAGGSFLVSAVASLLGFQKDESIIRVGRYLSFASVIISPLLLIKDLGRPERFINMLRVLKLRSVMSIGTWALSTFGLLCGLATAHQAAKDGLLNWFPLMARLMKALPIKVIESVGAFLGIVVASYTGVLLAATAVPVWARARNILGPLFFTSGLSTALAGISFILSLGPSNTHKNALERLERAEIIAATTELGLISVLGPTLGSLGKPLFTGRDGILLLGGTVSSGLITPLLLRLGWKIAHKSTPREVNIVASLLILFGGLILRYVWIDAGRKSADDPQATHDFNEIEWREKKQS
ncbi:MAG: polysulfide reductase NrfD [Ktedonobacteraceae bacterium]